MHPTIFGFIDSYIFFVCLGIIASFLVTYFYLKNKVNKNQLIDIYILLTFSIIGGIIFAILFENLYELIDKGSLYCWTWGMTFIGGLFGGVLVYIIFYLIYGKKRGIDILYLLIIAPGSVSLGHAFGRIGCFLHGCCYGKETTSWLGVKFPFLDYKVLPTQLFEAIFLFILAITLIYLAVKLNFKYNLCIYLLGYGLFRFINEFFRGDYRGGTLLGLSPSQWWSLIFILLTPLAFYLINKYIKDNNEQESVL